MEKLKALAEKFKIPFEEFADIAADYIEREEGKPNACKHCGGYTVLDDLVWGERNLPKWKSRLNSGYCEHCGEWLWDEEDKEAFEI